MLFNGFKPLFTALTPEDVNQFAFEIIQVLQGEGGTIEQPARHTASLTTTLADRGPGHRRGDRPTSTATLEIVVDRGSRASPS